MPACEESWRRSSSAIWTIRGRPALNTRGTKRIGKSFRALNNGNGPAQGINQWQHLQVTLKIRPSVCFSLWCTKSGLFGIITIWAAIVLWQMAKNLKLTNRKWMRLAQHMIYSTSTISSCFIRFLITSNLIDNLPFINLLCGRLSTSNHVTSFFNQRFRYIGDPCYLLWLLFCKRVSYTHIYIYIYT